MLCNAVASLTRRSWCRSACALEAPPRGAPVPPCPGPDNTGRNFSSGGSAGNVPDAMGWRMSTTATQQTRRQFPFHPVDSSTLPQSSLHPRDDTASGTSVPSVEHACLPSLAAHERHERHDADRRRSNDGSTTSLPSRLVSLSSRHVLPLHHTRCVEKRTLRVALPRSLRTRSVIV